MGVGNNCDYDADNFFHAAKIHTFSHKGMIRIGKYQYIEDYFKFGSITIAE